MSESYREQFPLLCDDLSDEEHYSPQFHRQYRQMTYRGRAKSNVKGAVAILKRWPEHWSSFLTYWWIGVVMICLMTFILYNSLFALSILPTANFKPVKSQVPSLTPAPHTSQQSLQFPNIYVHVFTGYKKDNDLREYLRPLEGMANKYPTFNYHIVVVLNDTLTEFKHFNAEENNANALNSLWSTDINRNVNTVSSKIKINHISLTEYLDNSPISKYWRVLPDQLIEFYVRAISIWDKGGITVNPKILTPSSSNLAYIKNLEQILKSYQHSPQVTVLSHKATVQPLHLNHKTNIQKVNNIRDIINVLENEDSNTNVNDEILIGAESKNIGLTAQNTHRRPKSEISYTTRSAKKRAAHLKSFRDNSHEEENAQTIKPFSNGNNESSLTILPSFLEYLFHQNTINQSKQDSYIKNTKKGIQHDTNKKVSNTILVLERKNNTNVLPKNLSTVDQNSYRPMIIPAKEVNVVVNDTKTDFMQRYGYENNDQDLTIDLKGNLLATKTACHAFLGTMFTDASHCGQEETLSDFLIRELSIFCKGVLSSCSGINLILL